MVRPVVGGVYGVDKDTGEAYNLQGTGVAANTAITSPLGRAADAASVSVALSTEDVAFLDGLETVLGTTAGAAVVTDANGTIQQYLRGIIVKLIAQLPASLGVKAEAASLPVTLSTENAALLDGIEGLLATIDADTGALAAALPQTDAQFVAALKAATATHSSVNSGTSSVTILASNANRKGARIFNTDANALYLDLSGGTAVAASRAQVKLLTDEGYDVPSGYTGLITGIWSADGSGVASVVEFTA